MRFFVSLFVFFIFALLFFVPINGIVQRDEKDQSGNDSNGKDWEENMQEMQAIDVTHARRLSAVYPTLYSASNSPSQYLRPSQTTTISSIPGYSNTRIRPAVGVPYVSPTLTSSSSSSVTPEQIYCQSSAGRYFPWCPNYDPSLPAPTAAGATSTISSLGGTGSTYQIRPVTPGTVSATATASVGGTGSAYNVRPVTPGSATIANIGSIPVTIPVPVLPTNTIPLVRPITGTIQVLQTPTISPPYPTPNPVDWSMVCCAECQYLTRNQFERTQCNAVCQRQGCQSSATCVQASEGVYAGFCQNVCTTISPTPLLRRPPIVTPQQCQNICRNRIPALCSRLCRDLYPSCNISLNQCLLEAPQQC